LGLADLETPTKEGGRLVVHVGDALAPEASVEGGFAGLEPFLFSSFVGGTAIDRFEADGRPGIVCRLSMPFSLRVISARRPMIECKSWFHRRAVN
jgi:hypothetical protein